MDQIIPRFDSVTVFGGATIDYVARSAAHPVMGASNPGKARRIVGGVGFNVASVLARLGIRTRLITRIGADADGEMIMSVARSVGVDTSAISVSPAAPSATYHAALDDEGNLIVGVADMAIFDEISPAVVAAGAKAASFERDFWIMDANLPEDTLAFLAVEANTRLRPIAALTVSPAKSTRLLPLLDRLSYLFANRREAAALLWLDPDDKAIPVSRLASDLARTRTTKVIVTNGTEPLAAASSKEVRSYAPFRAAVHAVNGAGDSLAAGTIRGLASGHPLSDAIRFGLAASAIAVEASSVIDAEFSENAVAERMGAGRTGKPPAQLAS